MGLQFALGQQQLNVGRLFAMIDNGTIRVIAFCSFFSVCSCQNLSPRHKSVTAPQNGVSDGIARERDDIAMLAAYAIVLKDWQTNGPERRGYNIGCVLVDSKGNFVDWGRNCNHTTHNGTQHGEVRAMLDYLDHLAFGGGKTNTGAYDLGGVTLYTTLEPCAMCSGMMTLLRVRRVMYGQTDPDFGKALERLQLDSKGELGSRGYAPYPRAVISVASPLQIRKNLDEDHGRLRVPVTDFLYSEHARQLFIEAARDLDGFKVKSPENENFLSSARELVRSAPDHYVPIHVHF